MEPHGHYPIMFIPLHTIRLLILSQRCEANETGPAGGLVGKKQAVSKQFRLEMDWGKEY